MAYAIKTRSGFVNGFYPNGLPTGSKVEYVEELHGLYPVLKLSEVILQSGGKTIFDTPQEAADYANYIEREVIENKGRYDTARPESTQALLNLIGTFTVVTA